MKNVADPVDRALLDDWQRDFPVEARPFAVLAAQAGVCEAEVLDRLARMQAAGRITRVGATCAPNTVSASTLAAIQAAPQEVERIAGVVGAEAGVNHSYLREDAWNLWFVATGPDRRHVNRALARISRNAERPVLDLRLVRPFNVDLGFRMAGGGGKPPAARAVDATAMRPGDRELLQRLTRGLSLEPHPWAALGRELMRPEAAVMERVIALQAAGVIARLGVIVRHRALGWRSNAMCVWDVSHAVAGEVGPTLAALPGVTLCYERRPVEGVWPYRLYNMIHARSRTEAKEALARVRALPGLKGARHKVLFSTRCFKQTGALIADREGERA
ncbi:Lrp/AsnC family transcriptional regulator [Psychromarinibacter sp. C21-152]|uniref:siroheme decarboxylase n=1 Tax=Psychromarinibacter sediminicola TaxID=3033385 RepID=A0AAE3NX09_9RHOB|nr:Lrp/AsnC family transcriptional regulator [Psychromarinibacter sediminicola]MDF0603541.1 Lrp/AsnC family transcriptional regulator [Psychromarinibacter sediminicola]